MSRDRHHAFGALRPKGAPPELREEIVAAARAAAEVAEPTKTPRETLTDRLWSSRPLRFAWAASLVALLATNLWLDAGDAGRSTASSREARVAQAQERDPSHQPRTLLASREAVLQALVAEEAGAGDTRPTTRPARRSS